MKVTVFPGGMLVKTPIFCKLPVRVDSPDPNASVLTQSERQGHDVVLVDALAKIEWLPTDDPESESEIETDRP
jgi:hypothetical protein